MRFLDSKRIRVKIFLRDDMLAQVVGGADGFTALTHITARQADTLRWKEDQILSMVVKRLFVANQKLAQYLTCLPPTSNDAPVSLKSLSTESGPAQSKISTAR